MKSRAINRKPGDRNLHYTKIPGYISPTKAMVKYAKYSLGIPSNVRLPRCMGKAVVRIKGLDDPEFHKAEDHICDECRCRYAAGFGTHHLGVGYCIVHEHSIAHRTTAAMIAENHKVAIRAGFPDKAWAYAQVDPDGYAAQIRKMAEDAGGMTDLREDIILLRTEIQKLLSTFDQKKIVKGYTKDGDAIYANDLDRVNAIVKLTRAVAALSVDNLKVTEDKVVTYDQVKIWAAGIISLIERMSPNDDFRKEFIGEFAKLFDRVKTGR